MLVCKGRGRKRISLGAQILNRVALSHAAQETHVDAGVVVAVAALKGCASASVRMVARRGLLERDTYVAEAVHLECEGEEAKETSGRAAGTGRQEGARAHTEGCQSLEKTRGGRASARSESAQQAEGERQQETDAT